MKRERETQWKDKKKKYNTQHITSETKFCAYEHNRIQSSNMILF